MYKLLLCWRYLLTRYLAFACIISVMLGVATLIVVNSVMSGFSSKLRDRLHGLLSDVVVESNGLEGFTDPEAKIAKIRQDPELNKRIKAMSATMEIFAMMQFRFPSGHVMTRTVRVVGVEPKSRGKLGGFHEFLVRQKSEPEANFDVPDDVKKRYEFMHHRLMQRKELMQDFDPAAPPPPMATPKRVTIPKGVIVGHLLCHHRQQLPNGKTIERRHIPIGSQVILTTVSGEQMRPVYDSFVVVDYFKSEMAEYDSQMVFVPLDHLQDLRTMQNRATSIQIKLYDYADADFVVRRLKQMFESRYMRVETWEDKQGALLAAIAIEKGILNVLLFLIVGVAGFGILAIFSMIVAEKTRDIGILKALGASNWGVMKIFLWYGLLLGSVGALLGTVMGLWLTNNINEVEQWLSSVTGQEIFDRKIYYFSEIPTQTTWLMLTLVNAGAIGIAVVFSILPALRAAFLNPVRALRYE